MFIDRETYCTAVTNSKVYVYVIIYFACKAQKYAFIDMKCKVWLFTFYVFFRKG